MPDRRGTLVVVCLATAMLMLDIAVVNTALSQIASRLHAGLTGLQWIVDAYTLVLASTVLSCGSIADRLGRRRAFAMGIAIFTAASAVCGVAGSIVVLDAARAVQGLGGALMFASSLALLAAAYPRSSERSAALAAYGAVIGGSFAVGPLVGGLLTSGMGWRWVFFVNVPLGLVGLLATRRHVAESRDEHARRLDVSGQTTLGACLFLLVHALMRGNAAGWSSAQTMAELGAGALLFMAFTAVERRAPNAMLPLELLRVPAFAGAQVAAFAISASFFAIYIYLTLYLQEVLHRSAIETGLAYFPSALLLFVVSGMSARLLERLSAGAMICGGLVLVAGGLVLLTLASPTSSWLALMPGMCVVSVGGGLFNPAISAVALSSAPPRHSGLAAGVNDTFRQGGIAIGVAIFGALIPAGSALGHGSAVAYVGGLHDALFVGAGIAAGGAVLSARLIGVGAARSLVPAPASPAAR